jgi:hypothetical protein
VGFLPGPSSDGLSGRAHASSREGSKCSGHSASKSGAHDRGPSRTLHNLMPVAEPATGKLTRYESDTGAANLTECAGTHTLIGVHGLRALLGTRQQNGRAAV